MSEVKHFLDKDKKDKSTRELLVKTDQELTKQNFKTEFLKKAFLFVGGLIVVLVIIGFSIVNFESRPVASSPSEYQYFEIKKGQTTKSIADELEKNGFIRSSMAFYLSVKSERISLQAGSYKLSASMTTGEIIKKLYFLCQQNHWRQHAIPGIQGKTPQENGNPSEHGEGSSSGYGRFHPAILCAPW